MSKSLPRWAPGEPKQTCPNINVMQDRLRDQAAALIAEAEAIRHLADELEQLRNDNVTLREWAHEIASEGDWTIGKLQDELKEAKKAVPHE